MCVCVYIYIFENEGYISVSVFLFEYIRVPVRLPVTVKIPRNFPPGWKETRQYQPTFLSFLRFPFLPSPSSRSFPWNFYG